MEYELYKKLTKRQLEIADCARRGFTDGQIANALDISVYTVKTHLKNIYEKWKSADEPNLQGCLIGMKLKHIKSCLKNLRQGG